jgi:pimeloyl-ACP methyl ester carboxylesterase
MSAPRVPNQALSVVLVHGQPGTREVWTRVEARLPPGVPVVARDRPGYGRNPEPATGLAANADRLATELRDVGLTRSIVVGHSWGGGVALALAERHPDAVGGLVLAASLGPGAVLLVDRLLGAAVVGPALVASGFRLGRPFARRRLRRLVDDDGDVDRILRANRPGRTWRSFIVEQRAMLAEVPGLVARLGGIPVPTIVVAGQRDRLVPLTTARALASAIPGAELRVVAGAGHDLPLEAPDAVVSAVVDLVGRVEADG